MSKYNQHAQKNDLLTLYRAAKLPTETLSNQIMSYIDAGEFSLALDGITIPFEDGSVRLTPEMFMVFQKLATTVVDLDDPEFKEALVEFRGGEERCHATKPAMSAVRRALPRRRALCTNWKKPR